MSNEPGNIVDCDLLEAAKENVQPLAAGRKVSALSSVLATPHARRDTKLAATRNRLRVNVQLALEDGDPLEAYCNLVYWTLENYPEGQNAESGLLELLEEATRVLKDHEDGHFRGDIKYLKLWTLYASFVDRPAVIFRFLVANEIGTGHALLYEEWANCLERNSRRADADAAYMLGIARQAEPLDRLKARHRDFQKRMMAAAANPPREEPSATSTTTKPRAALATTSGPSTTPPTGSTSSAMPNNGARMAVFVDPATQSASDLTGNAFPEIGTRKTRIKENKPEIGKLSGTTIKQAGKTKRVANSSGSKIVPFRDEPKPSGSKIVPFRDEPKPSGSKIVPFRDEPGPGPESSGKLIPFKDDPKPKAGSSKIVPFQDDPKPSKSKITPFRDEPSAGPKLGSFVPFKDTEKAETSAAPIQLPGGSETESAVMQVKVTAPREGSESEALRKDPLKNYGLIGED